MIRQLGWAGRGLGELTQIQDVAASTSIQAQRRIAGWAILRFEFPDVFVEAGFMRDVGARELQHAFAAKGVFQRLLAHGAGSADKSSLPTAAGAVDLHHASGGAARTRVE